MNILRQVPGVKFGPDVATWQSLVKALSENHEAFQLPSGDWITASQLTIESSELGNLLNPQDREMVDLLITLWDGRKIFNKITKMSGNETIENPWINLIACTTPAWIAGNFPEYMIGGGFVSRCIFIYAEHKEKYVAYPGLQVPSNLAATQTALVQDLERISLLSGSFRLLPSAVEWGNAWYRHHYENRPAALNDDRFGGYIARKQTHLHKLAMVLSAAQRDDLTLCVEDLATANAMLEDVELDMPKVFARIGKTEDSLHTDRLVAQVKAAGKMSYTAAYNFLQTHFPAGKDMEDILAGILKSGRLTLEQDEGGKMVLKPVRDTAGESRPGIAP